MKWTTRILFLLAITLSAAVIAMVSDQKSRTPESALDAIEATIERADFNHDAILRSLEVALTSARSAGDKDLQIRALLLRGDVLFQIGASDAAIRDYDEVSSLRGAPDEALLLRMAEAHVQAGDPDSGQRRIEMLLSINPSNPKGHVQEGRLHQASAKNLTDKCNEALNSTLPYNEAENARALVDRLTAQDLLDPRRAGVVSTLRNLFTEAAGERLARLLVLCDDASLYNRMARESYETSFAHGTEPNGVFEYITLLMRADKPEHAMRFGAQARKDAGVSRHHPTTLQLVRAHIAAGDGDGAGTLAAELVQETRDLTPQEYAVCCKALNLADRWSGLFYAANRMRSIGTAADGLEASLYLGIAQMGRKRYSNARTLLRAYASSDSREPYPGAQYEAWTILAELDRAAGGDFQERESVYAALQLNPNGEGASDLWIRLAELQESSGHTSLLLPLRSYAEALCRTPTDYPEVLARFEETGERAVAAEGRDLDLIYQDLVRERRSLPPIPLDAYSLIDLATRHGEDDNHLAVVSVCRRILDNHPNFIPAIDLMISSRLKLGRIRSATEQVVDRIDLTGLDDTCKEFIRKLPPSPFTTKQLNRIMRADPTWTGRLEIAQRLRREGSHRSALACIKSAQGGESGSEISLLEAEIHSDLGQRELALEALAEINPDDPNYATALLLTVKVASLLGDTDAIDAASDVLIERGDVDTLRSIADQLMFDRRIEKASPILNYLHEEAGGNDTWTLEHLILFHLVQGDVRRAREAASRAEAFSLSPLPPLGLVLASSLHGETERLKTEAAFLLGEMSSYNVRGALAWRKQIEGGVGEAILNIFAEDYERARALLNDSTLKEVQTPEWAVVAAGLEALDGAQTTSTWNEEGLAQARRMLHGSQSEPRETIAVLGVFLAAQTAAYTPYALQKLNQYTEGKRNAWDAYLIAKTLYGGGENLRARDALRSWTQPDSEYFAPSWALFETLEQARIGHYDHPDFDTLRTSMAHSLAKHQPGEVTTNVSRAHQAIEAGRPAAAVRFARVAHEVDPDGHVTNAALAKALMNSGDEAGALNYWINACEASPEALKPRYITSALESMTRALQSPGQTVLPSVNAGALQTLSSIDADDPRIPLALARIDLQQEADNPALGVTRAFRRLDNFLRSVRDVGLADLHPGAEEDWLDFYLRYGPEQALTFCRSQLEFSPGVATLWLGEVKALRALGRYEDGLTAAGQVLRMFPSGELYEEIAGCLQASGAPTKQVEDQLIKARQLRGELSVDAMLTRTKSLLAVKGERTAGQAIAVLSRVWDAKATGPLGPIGSEVGLLLSEGFMKRGERRDYGQAINLLEKVTKRGQDPYDKSLARALGGLCAQVTP